MKVICFGDSNTYGYDPRSRIGERYDEAWPELLARKTGWQVVNMGENGREIPKTAVTLPEDTDMLIVMLGTNDLLQFWSPAAAAEKMERFLSALPLEREKILLLGLPPMKLGEWVQDQELIDDAHSLSMHYKALAERLGIRYGRLDAVGPIAYDGVHLTQEGHHAFAHALYELLHKGE